MQSAVRGFGYNICPKANSILGKKATEATRAKMSANAKNRTFSKETRRKMSDNMKANWANPEYRATTGKKAIACAHSKEAVEQSRLKKIGRKHTPEAIAKIGVASRALSTEKREKMRLAMIASGVLQRNAARLRGKRLSKETINRMSVANKGVPKTAAHNAAVSVAITEWHRKRRRINEWFDAHVGMRPNAINWNIAA